MSRRETFGSRIRVVISGAERGIERAARSLARDADETMLTALMAVLAGDWHAYNGHLAA